MAERKPWPGDRVINPDFQAVVDQHFNIDHYGCTSITRPRYTTSKSHSAWRNEWKNHVGGFPPPTFLNENVNTKQFAPDKDSEIRNWAKNNPDNAKYDNDGNPVEGNE
jgi:hypothetical protein